MAEHADYIRGWRERAAAEAVAAERRAEQARRLLPTLVAHLVDKFDARRIVLFGSLAEGCYGVRSDIDLAVEGVAPASIDRAGAELDEIAAPFRVDLVPMESAFPELIDEIATNGEVLDDR